MIAGLKPYPDMKESGVKWLGAVPAQWEVHRLRSVADMRVSNVDKHTREGEQPVRLCNYLDVYKNDQIQSGMNFMPATATVKEIERFRLRSGDVLITKDSEAWNDIGVPALVREVEDDIVSGYHLALLRSRTSRIHGDYLFRAIQSVPVAYQFHVRANGVTRYGLSHEAIKSTQIPVPSTAEQAAIARFLDHLERRTRRYIGAKQKLLALLEEQKQAIVREVVTGRIDVRTGRPYTTYKKANPDWLGRVPTLWERARLKSLVRPVDHRSTTGTETLLSLRRDHGVVVYADHFSHPPQGATLVGFKHVRAGELVVNRLQANNGLVFCSNLDGLVSPDYSVFQTKTTLQMQYLSDLLRTEAYRTHFRQEARGLGTGTAGFLRLYDDAFLRAVVYLPPVTEQDLILRTLQSAGQKLKVLTGNVQQELALMKEFQTRLIADVVTGKLDVRDAMGVLTKHERNGADGEAVDCRGRESETQFRESPVYNETNG